MAVAVVDGEILQRREGATEWSWLVIAFAAGALLTWVAGGNTADHLRLAVCLLTSLAWMTSRADASVVALIGATGLACVSLLDGGLAAAPLEHLGDDTTVLIIAAFVVAKAVERSGLAAVLADGLVGQSGRAAYARLAAGIFAATFLIPSTAARASVLLPLVQRVKRRTGAAEDRQALALMAPIVVVVGAFGSPVAAGANLLAIQMLAAHSGAQLSFAGYVGFAAPLALLLVVAAVLVVRITARRHLVEPDIADHTEPAAEVGGSPTARMKVAGVLLVVVGLWATGGSHPLEPMLVAVLGAVLLTLPGFGVMTLQEGLKSVDWTLIVMLAATVYIGEAFAQNPLFDAGVGWLAAGIGGIDGAVRQPAILAALILTAMLAHVAVSSRSARAALLLPPALAIGTAAGLDATVVALGVAAATGFCILTPVGSKALMIFAGSTADGRAQRALVRTGFLLLPFHFALTFGFAWLVWPRLLGSA